MCVCVVCRISHTYRLQGSGMRRHVHKTHLLQHSQPSQTDSHYWPKQLHIIILHIHTHTHSYNRDLLHRGECDFRNVLYSIKRLRCCSTERWWYHNKYHKTHFWDILMPLQECIEAVDFFSTFYRFVLNTYAGDLLKQCLGKKKEND